MTEELYAFDAEYRARAGVVCGVDEAGRGPLCGPVCVAAVILDPAAPVDGVNDSKKLSEKKRELLYPQIIEKALAYKIVMVGPQTIDELNILNATLLGMRQAVEGLAVRPGLALIDGNRCPEMEIPAQSVVKGDARVFQPPLFWPKSRGTGTWSSSRRNILNTSWKSTRDIRPSCITRCWTNTAFSRFTAGPF